ncbi:VCBS domain-containing protein [Desulfovibrio caledoniensis]
MADTTIHQLHISLPGAGNIQTYQLDADTPVKFDFDLASAVFTGENGNLEITVEGGGTVILENYETLADTGSLPLFEMLNGEQVAGDVYLFAFEGPAQNGDLETAAANATGSSGAGQYTDDAGTLGDSLNALGGQEDAYGSHAFPTLSGVLGQAAPIAPTANDDFASTTEQGDPDFIVGRHIVFVDNVEAYQEAVHLYANGEGPAVGEFFPLSSGGGFYINNPNPPQTDETIEGNVIDNDVDPDGPNSQLSMYSLDYDGVNHDGVDPGAVQITSDDTVIVGKYGVLVMDTDGHWEYTLNQEWADALNEGESYDEIFQYNIIDSDGLVSNSATLTITVNGANDMPVAHDDLNVQAVEGGDSTDYGLHASVYDADLNDGAGGDVTVHDSEHHDYSQDGSVVVHGNVLSGDDAGSVADTDVDSGDSPDGQTMFVVGAYSHATETMDYVLPHEQNPDFTPSADQAYDQARMDPSASVTVNGEFGVLTIHADGSYDYRLYTPGDGDAYNALNALNYGSEDNVDAFSYGIMDDSGALSYANISFTVNGANDAPVANADQNNVAEFGLRFEGGDYSAVVSGNVVTGDAHGGVADTDVDDTQMFVSSVSSQTDHNGTLYTDDNMDPNGSVTIDGEYGTLTIHADGSYDYTLHNEWDNVQALQEGEVKTDVFTYTLTNPYADGVYSEPATLTINVTGSNDAPTAMADTNTLTESVDLDPVASVSGNVLAGDAHGGVADTDVDNEVGDFTITSVTGHGGTDSDADGGFDIVGQYGTLHMNADGSYTYTENPDATDFLNNDSAPVTDVFTYTMTDNADGHPGTASSTLTITINGANDAPTAMADTNTLTESVDDAAPASVSGNVLAGDEHGGVADTDADNEVGDFSVTAVTGHGGTDSDASGGFDIVGQYGTLHMNADGSYTYTENPDATDHLNSDSDPVTDVFTYTMSDNQSGDAKESSATLTITINGANDAPEASDDYNLAKEAGFYTDGFDASGNVIHGMDLPIIGNIGGDTDVDNTDLTVTHVSSDDNAGSEADVSGTTTITGLYGTLYIEPDGSYHYEVNNDLDIVNELNVQDHPTDNFTYTVSDGMGGTDTATLHITVWGSDDAPTAVDDANNGSVIEAGSENEGNAIAHGFVLANDSDVDSSVIFVTKAGAGAEGSETGGQAGSHLLGWTSVEGQYGTLYFKPSGEYRYELNNNDPDTQALAEGQVVHDEFNYTVSDLLGATDTATLSIEVTGANDAATITGDSTGAVTEDVNVSTGGLLTDSGQLFASDPDNPDNLFQADTITDSQGGTFHINADGTWTYEIDNGSVQHLGEVDGVNSGFSNDFTVHSADGTEHTVTVTVSGENDAPLGADFSVHGNAYGEPIGIDFDQAPITDVEDDHNAGDGLDTGVVITGLPDHGTLYYGDHQVTQDDVDNGTRFDDLDNFTYKGEAPAGQGVLIGSRLAEDAGLDTWGEADGNATRKLSVDTDGDGTPDVTVTTHISEGRLKVYADQQNHIDHGLANQSHNGLDSGETLTMTFEGRDVSYADIGFGGLGGYFDHGSQQNGQATWAVYDGDQLIASGTVDNSVMTWTNAITGQSGTITGGDGDTFQSLVLDQTILGGEHFDKIVFGTTEDGPRDWNANWELQYVDVEFAGSDTITYRPVDSEGQVSDSDYTVTVDVLPGQANEDPTAVNDAASVNEPNSDGLDYSVSANVLANDVDTDNTHGEMSVTKVTFGDTTVDFANHQITGTHAEWGADGTVIIHGEHGDLVIGADGDYTYTATDNTLVPGDAPTETFSYTMTDGHSVDSADLAITVNGLNDAPDAVDDGVSGLTGATHDVALNIANGFAADGITIVEDQTTDNTIIHDTFGLGVKTGPGDNPAIDTTQGAGTEKVTFQFDDPQTHATITLADFNNTDHDDDAIITLLNADGEVVGTYNVGVDQTNPTIDLTGSEPFVYVVVEPAGSSEDGFYIQSISGQVTDYSSTDGAIVVAEDSSITIDVLANDTDPDLPNDHLSITGLGDPAHGSVAIVNGEVVYTPDADYNGADSFTYTITDDHGATDTATVYLNVTPVNDAPVAANDTVTVLEDHTATGNVIQGAGAEHLGQDTDIDGDSLTVTGFTIQGDATSYAAGETAHIDGVGDLVINADGSYTFTPTADYDGEVPTATYTVTDGNGGYDSADLSIDITPVNDAPTIDLSMGTVTFQSEDAGNNNMVGVYELDAEGNPVNPQIILVDSNHGTDGQLLTTFGDGQELHYFLVPNTNVGSGVPTFVPNGSGGWDISFDGGATSHEVRFDDAGINNNPENTFRITTDANGRLVSIDDQMRDDQSPLGDDDDDFNDLVIRENDHAGTGFENTFVEDGGPVHVTGEVHISDVDSANMSQAVITLTNAHDMDALNIDTSALPDGITATVNGTQIILSGDAPISDYESAIEQITFSNGSDDPDASDRLINVQVWDDASDPTGAPSNVATTVIHVVPVDDNTPPVAVDDTGSGSGTISGDGGVGNAEGSDAFHLVAQEFDAQSGKWVQATLSDWGNNNGSHYGVESASGGKGNGNGNGGNSGDDKFIENNSNAERLLIQFDDPQTSVSLKLTGDGNGQESLQAWDADGNPITDLTISESGDVVTLSSPTAAIGTVVVMADPDDPNASVALKEVTGSDPVDHLSGTYEAAVITGNVLANDHDAQDTDYTDGPGFPAGSTELTVTGAAAGDLDDLTQAQYDQHLANGDFTGDSGTFSLSDDGVGVTVHGQFGDLVIAEDGSYTYTTHDGLPVGDYTESFTYQVSDTDGAVDYGVIEVNATINTLVAHADLGHGAMVTDTLEPAYQWQGASGHDINFANQTDGNPNEWQTLADNMGLKVSATIDGLPAWVGEVEGLGIGVNTPLVPDTHEIENGPLYREALTLDFGQDGHALPEQLYLMLNNVSTGEDVIFTITDSNDHTYTVHVGSGGNNATYSDGTGTIVLTKANNNQYYITGSHQGQDGTGELLIKSVTLGGAWHTRFSLNYINATTGGHWVQNGTTGELTLPSVNGSLFGNVYSSDDAAMTAAIVGSGVGAWGTLQIAANGEWTYTPNENAHSITTDGLTEPTVEQFTYQVTDSHGLTDTATLYIPVHVNATVNNGTDGVDVINGTDGNNVIYGHGGDDVIHGQGGNDFLYGGAGDDIINGGAGHDYISGGDGNDTLHGGDGNDYLFGGNGDDVLWGGAGNDVIHAGAGNDTVFISSGHDTVTLGAGEDTIMIDPSYLTSGEGGGSMTVTDFNIGEGDHLDLSALSAGLADVTSAGDSGDLIVTIADVNPAGDDITITLQGVLPPTHDAVDHQVDLSATGEDLNTVIQHIINSGGHSS